MLVASSISVVALLQTAGGGAGRGHGYKADKGATALQPLALTLACRLESFEIQCPGVQNAGCQSRTGDLRLILSSMKPTL